MHSTELNGLFNSIDNIRFKLDEAAEAVVTVELLMRLIGEESQLIQVKLKELVKKSEKKRKSDKYWDCDLNFVDDAINAAFCDKLELGEIEKLKTFRLLRNKLHHADFVGLMKLLQIPPTGRQYLSADKMDILIEANLKESIMSAERNQVFAKLIELANEVIIILHKVIKHC